MRHFLLKCLSYGILEPTFNVLSEPIAETVLEEKSLRLVNMLRTVLRQLSRCCSYALLSSVILEQDLERRREGTGSDSDITELRSAQDLESHLEQGYLERIAELFQKKKDKEPLTNVVALFSYLSSKQRPRQYLTHIICMYSTFNSVPETVQISSISILDLEDKLEEDTMPWVVVWLVLESPEYLSIRF